MLAVVIIVAGFAIALPHIIAGGQATTDYLSLHWAKDHRLITVLIYASVMLWLLISALFWGGWLLRRSVRKLRGASWRVVNRKDSKLHFFPPVVSYLKISCAYLFIVLLYVIFQYPIQYIIFYSE